MQSGNLFPHCKNDLPQVHGSGAAKARQITRRGTTGAAPERQDGGARRCRPAGAGLPRCSQDRERENAGYQTVGLAEIPCYLIEGTDEVGIVETVGTAAR